MIQSIPRRAIALFFLAAMVFAASVIGVSYTSPASAQTVTVGDGNPNMNRVTNSLYSDAQVLVCDDAGGCKTVSPGRTASADLASMPQNVALAPYSDVQFRLVHPNGYVQPWQYQTQGSAGGWVHAGNLFRFFGCYTGCLVQVMYDSPTPPSQHTDCLYYLEGGCVKNESVYFGLIVCENWSGTAADPGCQNSSRTENVLPGQWSTYNDTDGFYVPAGYNAVMDGDLDPWADTITATGWHKVQNGQNWRVYLVRE